MMDTQSEMNRERRSDSMERMRESAARERNQNERLARQLSTEAMKNWQRSVEGMLALPTAAALGVASSTLYMASLVTRAFEMFQQSTIAIREGMEQTRRELREAAESDDVEVQEGRGRSARKRASHEITKLDEELVALRPEQGAALALAERLEDAIAEARRLTSFGAKRRQAQFIGKLMRKLDEEQLAAIRKVLERD